MRQPLVAGNWKLNGSLASTKELLAGIKAGLAEVVNAEVAVCPPYIFIPEAQAQLADSSVAWGGQNLSAETGGAFTGEISASMLLDFGCKYVLVGHSERRTLYGEDNALVAKKFAVAKESGLIPILCVGETLEERQQGITEDIVAGQLAAVTDRSGIAALDGAVVAYEPVWAIGTGMTASPEQAQAVHAYIRSQLAQYDSAVANNMRILYGGSMKPENAVELLTQNDIDGGLIGGAALKAEDFLSICKAAN